MYYQPFLLRAIAMEPHFWPDIDKKYIELGVPGVVRTGKVISCINELPPKALLRAIKLLAINEQLEGKQFTSDLMNKVFKKEIEAFDKLYTKGNISFPAFLKGREEDMPMSQLTRKAAIFACLCDVIGHPTTDELVEDILTMEEDVTLKLPMKKEAVKMADDWLKKWGNPKTLNELNYIDDLYTDDYLPYGKISVSENIPLRAVEEYVISKDDVHEIVNIAQACGRPFDIDRLVVTSYIVKSLARYAEECKNAYLDMALSPEIATNKIRKADLAKKQHEVDQLNKLLCQKQEQLNVLQLQNDRQQKRLDEQSVELQQVKEYSAALEAQLEAEDIAADEVVNACELPIPDTSSKKIVVIGGFFSWQQRLKEIYPNFTYIDTDNLNFDVNLVRDADLILFNFLHASHGLYYRLKANCNNDKIAYIANNNIAHFKIALVKNLK